MISITYVLHVVTPLVIAVVSGSSEKIYLKVIRA